MSKFLTTAALSLFLGFTAGTTKADDPYADPYAPSGQGYYYPQATSSYYYPTPTYYYPGGYYYVPQAAWPYNGYPYQPVMPQPSSEASRWYFRELCKQAVRACRNDFAVD
jgi:hypothetical protein